MEYSTLIPQLMEWNMTIVRKDSIVQAGLIKFDSIFQMNALQG